MRVCNAAASGGPRHSPVSARRRWKNPTNLFLVLQQHRCTEKLFDPVVKYSAGAEFGRTLGLGAAQSRIAKDVCERESAQPRSPRRERVPRVGRRRGRSLASGDLERLASHKRIGIRSDRAPVRLIDRLPHLRVAVLVRAMRPACRRAARHTGSQRRPAAALPRRPRSRARALAPLTVIMPLSPATLALARQWSALSRPTRRADPPASDYHHRDHDHRPDPEMTAFR